MAATSLDVVGIGNAIVDVLAHADDEFLETHGLVKGAMTLIDEPRSAALYTAMGPGIEISGGSAGNTLAGIAALGGRGAFIGKVRDDQLGELYRRDIRAAGVAFETAPATDGPTTGRCLVLVTPDAQRTMNTFLGAAVELTPDDLDEATIRAAQVTYMEGYLWDPPAAKQAFLAAAKIAHGAGRKVSLSLSDPFCVSRHHDSFLKLVSDHVDVLFANEAEICGLYQTESFDGAAQQVRGHCEIAVLTRGDKGAVVLAGEEMHVIEAEPVARIVDTTGAGDLYAAGFLAGLTQDRPLYECGRMGAIAAAEVISHIGARPETDLAALVRQRLHEA
jgi:sugar/nucleoside kinase (ribokinase family)